MWNILRNKGDHQQNKKVLGNGEGEFIIGRRPSSRPNVSHYGPCPQCLVWLKLDVTLVKHQTICPCRILGETDALIAGKRELFIMSLQTAGKISTYASKALQDEVFKIMTIDEISKIAQSDKLIISLGNLWLLKNAGNRLKRKYYTSSHMRGAARLLMNLRKITDSPEASFDDLLTTSHFDAFVKGALITASPDDEEELQAPSVALKLGYDLKRLVGAKWGLAVRKKDNEAEDECKKFLKLMKFEWTLRVSQQAYITLQTRQFNKEKSLPEPDDLVKLNSYIKEELTKLDLNTSTYEMFRRAERLAQARLLIYNKRRSGEVEVICIKDYVRRCTGVTNLDRVMREKLSVVELRLLESQDLLEVRGKNGRGVPVIIPEDLREGMAYLTNADVRLAAGVSAANKYLFPSKGTGVIRAYDSLKMMCSESKLQKPDRITSVYLRKYMATVSQIFDLSPHQLQWVSNHLGHSVDIHKIHYRQTSGVIERVDMSKLMLLQEYNLTANYAGKSLDKIQLPEIVFGGTEDQDNSALTDEDMTNGEHVVSLLETPDGEEDYEPEEINEVTNGEVFDEFDFGNDDEEEMRSKKKRKEASSTRVKWTREELVEVDLYFKEHLSSRTTPGRQDCIKAIELSKKRKGVLQRRNWETLKKKVWNLIQKN